MVHTTLTIQEQMLCERIRDIRISKGYGQDDWAALLGETPRHIRAMERLEITVTSHMLQRLIELFDYSGHYLLTGEGQWNRAD
ncbi:helix-turn-helix domain-containing protein [Thiolinea disciformis]|uniref:helix-turn-helix domain-containing protein n=1 Tax=Thiolinea disciformis TaxID=125614 RepID=UPI00036CBCBC|nr:helix-turn-helix transcriptional regulator [Thiolinea disciformis]